MPKKKTEDVPAEELQQRGGTQDASKLNAPVQPVEDSAPQYDGALYSCGDGFLTLLAGDPALNIPGAVYELAPKGACTINGNAYPLTDLKRGDKVCLEGDPVKKITATR